MKEDRMMNRLIMIVLMILSGSSTLYGSNNNVDILLENKDVLIKRIYACSTKNADPIMHCYFPEWNTLINLLKSDKVTGAEKKRIEILYFTYHKAIIQAGSSGPWLADSINFNFFIESLRTGPANIAIKAYSVLAEESAIKEFRKHRAGLKNALLTSPISSRRKIRLLGLASESAESIKDSSSLETEVKNYLSDTVSVNRFITDLDSSTVYKEKEKAIRELLYRGNRKCLNALILHFNEPCFDYVKVTKTAPPCTTGTLRIPVIKGLSRYYPDIPLLNDSLTALLADRNKMNDREYVSTYFESFLTWAKEEFGVEPKDPPLPPMIRQSCREY